ncbi:MAG: adenylate/guanylate cyclase domain-containing protein [Geminicoccaceae bacterium]
MTAPRPERQLAAILAADVVNYSGLVERDEAETLARLARLRGQVIEPLLAEHRGRLVKLLGDGLLAEFASVVDAAACAVAIQARNDTGLSLRIGLNLGDVVVADEDLYGDGVNVAARLEGLAEAGGIVVSGTVRDQLHGQPSLAFASLGEPRLKNIARPVRAYRLVRGGAALLVAPVPGTPERPSIAVLPFDNLSSDPDQDYFSDGITEDLITAISRFRDLRVLARHSSFALRGQALDAVEIGRRLGVGYLLEGSVRKTGGRVRVTAQLIDAAGATICGPSATTGHSATSSRSRTSLSPPSPPRWRSKSARPAWTAPSGSLRPTSPPTISSCAGRSASPPTTTAPPRWRSPCLSARWRSILTTRLPTPSWPWRSSTCPGVSGSPKTGSAAMRWGRVRSSSTRPTAAATASSP